MRQVHGNHLKILHLGNFFIGICLFFLEPGTPQIALISLCFCYSIVVVILELFSWRHNALFCARQLMLALPGYYPMAVQLVNRDLYYSNYDHISQTFDITILMYALTCIALAGSHWGLRISRQRRKSKMQSNYFWKSSWIFYVSFAFLILTSYYLGRSYGETLFHASYASAIQESSLGNLNVIGGILLFIMWISYLHRSTWTKSVLLGFAAFYFLIYSMLLRGGRQDVLSTLFGCYIISYMFRKKMPSIRLSHVLAIIPIVVAMEFLGFIRQYVLSNDFNYGFYFHEFLNSYGASTGTVSLGTTGPISSTFANTIFAIKTGLTGFIFGKGYLEYLPRTPPSFIYYDRPDDYAVIMFRDWHLISGGGFFELAEAFLNFGVVGALLIPMAISWIISRVFFICIDGNRGWAWFFLFGILSVFLRGAWYQTFAYYKAILTAEIIFGLLLILNFCLQMTRQQSQSTPLT